MRVEHVIQVSLEGFVPSSVRVETDDLAVFVLAAEMPRLKVVAEPGLFEAPEFEVRSDKSG